MRVDSFWKKNLLKLNCRDIFLGFAATMEAEDNRHRGYGDGPRMVGVRFRGYVVEIKNWREGENIYKDVKASEEEAAMVHDLARLCSDPPVEEQKLRLNIETIARRIGGDLLLNIDKNFLIEFLKRHPVAGAGATAKERADAVMKAVVKLAPVALQELKEIVREQSSRGGRQRTDLQEIPPVVQDDDHVREIQHLKATILAMEAREKATFLAMEAREKATFLAMEARDKEMNVAIMALLRELYAATERASANAYPFKQAFAEREGIILHNDSDADVSGSQWMDMCLN